MTAKASKETVSPNRLAWLEAEAKRWESDGDIEGPATEKILSRYSASVGPGAARVILFLGTAVFGVGLVWLVASNLDWMNMSPAFKAIDVIVLWLALVAATEVISSRSQVGPLKMEVPASAARVLVSIAYGAAVAQVAQSLQVPANEPMLLGVWSAGTLAYAYSVRSVPSLIVGILVGAGWYISFLAERTSSGSAIVLGLALATLAATSLAAIHERWGISSFSKPWRTAGVIAGVLALFISATPGTIEEGSSITGTFLYGAIPLTLLSLAVAFKSDSQIKLELAVAFAVVLAAAVLVQWSPDTFFDPLSGTKMKGGALAHTLIASTLFLAMTVWVSLLGVLRFSPAYITLASIALIVFTIVQSFSLVAPIVTGALMFVVIGALLIAISVFILAGRRLLIEEVRP